MITDRWLRVTAWAAGLVAAAAALHIVQFWYEPVIKPMLGVLVPFSIAVALAILLDPTIAKLERRGLSRGLAVGLIVILFAVASGALAVFFIPAAARQATELAEELPGYYVKARTSVEEFAASHKGILERFEIPTTAAGMTSHFTSRIQSSLQTFLSGFGSWLGGLINKVVWLVLIPIITIFIVVDIHKMKQKALLAAPERHRTRVAELAGSVGKMFGAYVRGLFTVALLYGIACGVALSLWGVPYAVLLGVAAGALSLVPYIGTISTVLLVALVALASHFQTPLYALWVSLTILALNQIFDNIVTPRIVGKAVGIHPALAILALLLGGGLFGIVGMIFAVPVAASIQMIILEFFPQFKEAEQEEEKKEPKPSLLSRIFRKRRASKQASDDTE